MQQECRLESIMTSRRGSQTRLRSARFVLSAIALVVLSACAALPDDAPVVEKLDTETGATVARLGRPIELYRETFLQDPAGRFAFLGPFETNLMGQRELFLWIAVPMEPATDTVPTVEVNGTALALDTPGRSADFAGVHQSPYKIPTPWSAMYYFKVDAAVIAQLGEATRLAIRMDEPGKNGAIKTVFATDIDSDPRLRDFAAR
jgi:hypothetical protein